MLIRADGLTKKYGSKVAIQALSFEVKAGQIVGLLGPNGAGKSTTIRILAGLLTPSSGTASVAGHDVVLEPLLSRGQTGYVPEVVSLYPEMTVEDYLSFIGRLRRLQNLASRVRLVAEMCGLTDKLNAHIGRLSHGYRQRVGLAQALIHEPAVLILDEPTTGLDPVQILEMRSVIRRLSGKHTVLLSTHILAEAEQVCDRVLIIDKGRIVGDTILNRPGQEHKTIILRLRQAAPDVASVLAAVDGVAQVESMDLAGRAYRLQCSAQATPEAEVARVAVQRGWALIELTTARAELEKLFLQSIGREEL